MSVKSFETEIGTKRGRFYNIKNSKTLVNSILLIKDSIKGENWDKTTSGC